MRQLLLASVLFWFAGISACATHTPAITPRVRAPLPWPASLADLTWLDGRWAGRDAAGICHIEHWLGARSGLMWHIEQHGAALSLTAVHADDAHIGTRELVLGERRYARSGDSLTIETAVASLTLETAPDITATCPPPSP